MINPLLGELMNSLKLFPFMNKGRLTGTDDLNNVLTSGIYEISAPTTGVLNGKDIQYGILIVFSAGQRIQLLGNGLYGNAYFRTGRDNGRWYDWVSIYWHKIYSKRELGELLQNAYDSYSLKESIETEIGVGLGVYYITQPNLASLSCIVIINYDNYQVLGMKGNLSFSVSLLKLTVVSKVGDIDINVRKILKQ